MQSRNNGGKDYVVVIEATEVGDPTGGISFKFIDEDVENLTVKILIDNLEDNQDPGEQILYFSSVKKDQVVVICDAFNYSSATAPETVKMEVKFSTPDDATFTLAPAQGMNNNYTSLGSNTFVDNTVPVGTPAYDALTNNAHLFIQCLGEEPESKAFLSGDTQTGQLSMKESYTSQTVGMTWILGQTPGGDYYLQLSNAQGDFYLHGNTENGTLQLMNNYDPNQFPGLNWKFVSGNSSEQVNYYQMECQGNGIKLYLKGDTGTGTLSLVESFDGSRDMLWYMHQLNY